MTYGKDFPFPASAYVTVLTVVPSMIQEIAEGLHSML